MHRPKLHVHVQVCTSTQLANHPLFLSLTIGTDMAMETSMTIEGDMIIMTKMTIMKNMASRQRHMVS